MEASTSPQLLAVGERNPNHSDHIPNIKTQQTYASHLITNHSATNSTKLILKPVQIVHGEPTIQFTMEERQRFAVEEGLHQAVVVKLSQRSPALQDLRNLLPKVLGIKGHCLVGQLDPKQLLIRLDQHDDLVTALARAVNYFPYKGEEHQYRIFPWTIGFNPNEETTMAVVWIPLPNLSPELFARKSLLSIASAVGKPIAIDKATQVKSRPSTARVRVIVDLVAKLPQRVRLQYVDNESGKVVEVFQEVVYDNLPGYCNICKHQGHVESACRVLKKKNIMVAVAQIEEDQPRQEQIGGAKYKGDLHQFLNERRALNDGDRTTGDHINPTDATQVLSAPQGAHEHAENLIKTPHVAAVSTTALVPVEALANVSHNVAVAGQSNSRPVSMDATGDRNSMEKIAAGQSRRETSTEFKGTGVNIEAVSTAAAIPIGAGQNVENKNHAGGDTILKDIPATTVMARMYSALGTTTQMENGTVGEGSRAREGVVEQHDLVTLPGHDKGFEFSPTGVGAILEATTALQTTGARPVAPVEPVEKLAVAGAHFGTATNVKSVVQAASFDVAGDIELDVERFGQTPIEQRKANDQQVIKLIPQRNNANRKEQEIDKGDDVTEILGKRDTREVGGTSANKNNTDMLEAGPQHGQQSLAKGWSNGKELELADCVSNSEKISSPRHNVLPQLMKQQQFSSASTTRTQRNQNQICPASSAIGRCADMITTRCSNKEIIPVVEELTGTPTILFSSPQVEKIIKESQIEMMMYPNPIFKQPLVTLNTSAYDIPSQSCESLGEHRDESGQPILSTGNNNEIIQANVRDMISESKLLEHQREEDDDEENYAGNSSDDDAGAKPPYG
ncbi:PREDICTED: uncharacterized protein LOC109238702 [Nicotiana attenuata]|uniref:uncharacterized protein LOC109238702 n=1 Tax=Nicotiana attenuata TaxID=49451 RepID=UPI0009055EAD|nr:PREDICTED: uncharacterized protein LOC109238702 [Nicotiana attenuata]XP_019260724.1 PREDICTED: uncharacterized protein LOC109238702 [Nicotiana attenuata]